MGVAAGWGWSVPYCFCHFFLLQGKCSSQVCLVATWLPSHKRQSSMNFSSHCGRAPLAAVLPALSCCRANIPQSHGLFQDHLSAAAWTSPQLSAPVWVFPHLSANWPFLHWCSLRIAGSHTTILPQAKTKWLLWCISTISSSLLWVTVWLPLLPSYPPQNKRDLPKQKPLWNQFPLLKMFIHRGIDWLSFGQRRDWIGAREGFLSRKTFWEASYRGHATSQSPTIKTMPNSKPPHLARPWVMPCLKVQTTGTSTKDTM